MHSIVQGVGQPSLNHCFSQNACFDHALFLLMKNGWIDDNVYHKLFKSDAAYGKLRNLIAHSYGVSFGSFEIIASGKPSSQKSLPNVRKCLRQI